LGRWWRSNCKFTEKMAISLSSVLARKKSGDSVEEDAEVR
jgi:hypothetical protein